MKRSAPSVTRKAFDPFLALLRQAGLPEPITEYAFAPGRKFRADYAWVEPDWTAHSPRGEEIQEWLDWHRGHRRAVIVEKQGGIWRRGGKGAHTGGSAQLRDFEKFNLAQELGYRVLQYTPEQLQQQATLDQIRRVLGL